MGGKPAPYTPAVRTFGVWTPETGLRFDFAVFYPGPPRVKIMEREGRLLYASDGGRVTPGFYPIILFSHDTAGGRFTGSDTATALAANGFIVIAPTHAGDSRTDSGKIYTAEGLALRPRQMLAALDAVLASPAFAPYADESRIGLLGLGFGSLTVMQLAGARPELSLFSLHCGSFYISDGINSGYNDGMGERAGGGSTGTAYAVSRDPLCSAWITERMSAGVAGAARLEEVEGRAVFTPSLTLYAPTLRQVPLPMPEEDPRAKEKEKDTGSLWARLFGSEGNGKKEAPQAETPAPEPLAAAGEAEDAGVNPVADMPRLYSGFPGESVPFLTYPFSETLLAAADTGDAPAESIEEMIGADVAARAPASAKGASYVYRRPAEVRAVKGLALLAPAGGMLFPPDVLEQVFLPAAVVTAGKDGLYRPDDHAGPYLARLPSKPRALRLETADHFSLFAPCSDEALERIEAVCGNLKEEERAAVTEERDAFLLSFFRDALGGPLDVPTPSGFAAVPRQKPAEVKAEPPVQEIKKEESVGRNARKAPASGRRAAGVR